MIAPGPIVGIVEDDDRLREMMVTGLAEEGFRIGLATRRGQDLLGAARSDLDVAILDIGLPDSDGRDVVATLRASGSDLPVLLLTALSDLEHRLSGFRAGADDYLPKPFAFDELILRTRALLRRNTSSWILDGTGPLAVGTFLDHASHAISRADRSVSLTPTEFRLMSAMLSRRGEVVRRRALVSAGWPYGEMVHENTLDAYVVRLRRRLRAVGSELSIVTLRGVGYRLDA
jgi:two-component system OmpR family response regulator